MNAPRRFNRTVAVGLVALLFVLGIVVGVLGTHLFYAHRLRQPGALADVLVNAAAARATDRLDLRPDQREQLDGILETTRRDLQTLREDLVDRLRAIRARDIARLVEILDGDQRRRLEQLHATEGQVFDDYLSPREPEPAGGEK